MCLFVLVELSLGHPCTGPVPGELAVLAGHPDWLRGHPDGCRTSRQGRPQGAGLEDGCWPQMYFLVRVCVCMCVCVHVCVP